ncbi:hypothetical protein ABW21_db0204923 [Orbilia brochopaga]|nr:hypothetical protein ABW21_db0204923 [Drechslerella brochopaga]
MPGSAETLNERRPDPKDDSGVAIENDKIFLPIRRGPENGKTESSRDPYLINWNGHQDPGCPKGFKKKNKWIITLIVAAGAFNTTCASSIYTSTYEQIERDFKVSHEVAILGLSLFVMGLGIGPMFLAPLSEFYGRRPIYIVSFACYVLFLIPCAAAQNITTLLVGRFLDGIAGSAFLSVAGGTVGDMFDKCDLGLPMMVYTASPFVGPEIGPLIGGFINENTNWRWTWYAMIIWSSVQWILLCLIPETYNPVLLQRKAAKIRRETRDDRYYAPYDRREDGILKMYQTLGNQYATLILALLTVAMAPFPFLFFKYGERLRKHSRYAESPY